MRLSGFEVKYLQPSQKLGSKDANKLALSAREGQEASSCNLGIKLFCVPSTYVAAN